MPDVYSDSVRDKVRSAVEPLFSMFGFLTSSSVEMVQSHGDFSPPTYWFLQIQIRELFISSMGVHSKKMLLVRCFGLCCVPVPKGFTRISDWLSDHEQAFQSISWSGLKRHGFIPDFVLASFLMEDLLFRLDDTNVPGLLQPNVGFLTFVDELSAAQIELTQ